MVDFSLIEKNYTSLDKTSRDMLFSRNTSNKLLTIAEDAGLTEKGAEDLFDTVTFFILKMKSTDEFRESIQKIADTSVIDGINKEECFKKIIERTNAEILSGLNKASGEDGQKTAENSDNREGVQEMQHKQTAPLPEINPDTREKLELRPQGVPHMPAAAPVEDPGARPLTREEVLRTLAPKRTLASDIESLRQQGAVAEGYTTPQQTEDKE